MFKPKKHMLTPYPMSFQMFVGEAALTKECKKKKIPVPDFSENLGACARRGSEILIYVSDKHEGYLSAVDTIIHESTHAFQALVEFIAEADPSDEFQAYTIAHIATTCIAEYTQLIGEQDALHKAGRDEGLQTGEQVVQQPPGTNQEPLGTDSGEAGSECQWTDT